MTMFYMNVVLVEQWQPQLMSHWTFTHVPVSTLNQISIMAFSLTPVLKQERNTFVLLFVTVYSVHSIRIKSEFK